jgi:hypothetical protein
MKRKHIVATIAFILTARCLPIPLPADASDPVTAWQMQDRQWVPIMSFGDAESCARAARALAEKTAYVRCAASEPTSAPPVHQQPLKSHKTFTDVIEEHE